MSTDPPTVDLTPPPVEQPGLLAELWRTVGLAEWHSDITNYCTREES